MTKYIMLIFILLVSDKGLAQKFWLTTYEFPGRAKTGITLTPNNCLFVSLTKGVIRSCNEGNKFDSVLISNPVFSIFSNQAGEIFVGGSGKIYISKTNGQKWDSIALATTYPITRIIANKKGQLYAITGVLTANGFEGDGVFFSEDNGSSWTQRNNGLGIYTCIEQIAIDKNDRLYIATADEFVTGNGGLFISENNGLLWEHINIQVNGQGIINNQIKIANCWGISVSKSDSVYFSFLGSAVNVGVRLNTVKHIDQVRNNSFWNIFSVVNSPLGQDKLLNNIHFAKNGDKYSSVSGSINFGGTFFSKRQTYTWQKINFGLGIDENGSQNIQHFAETPSGKIFMVQQFDERVYFADTSVLTSVFDKEIVQNKVSLFPNPVIGGENIFLKNDTNLNGARFQLIDVYGIPHLHGNILNENTAVKAPNKTGVYMLLIEKSVQKYVGKLIVH